MAIKSDTDIIFAIAAIASFSFLGWLIFNGFNELFPVLSGLHPIAKILIGVGGLWLLVKLGIRKIG